MDSDLALVIGLVIAVFSIPSVISAFSDGRAPRVAAFALIAGGALAAWAVTQKPGGYTVNDVPQAFVKVVARYIN